MTGFESKITKQNHKMQLINHAFIISKWIDSFNSKNISDFFNSELIPDPTMIVIQQ